MAVGQTLSDDELLRMFQMQREAFQAVQTGTGKTRGLTLLTLDETGEAVAPATGDVAAAAPVTGDSPAPLGTDPQGGAVTLTEAPITADQPVAQNAPALVQPVTFGLLPKELQVNIRIRFDFDSASIAADQAPVLDQMCKVMKASDIKLFRIVGHTNSAGTDAYNERLSLLRAEEVKRRMVKDCGIGPDRLEAMGLGERFLFDPADPKGPENRRVEFQALS